MKQTTRHMLSTLGIAMGLAFILPGLANANERQQCLNNCTQAGATQQKQCKADSDKEMIRCGQLGTNEERNMCKNQANTTLKTCNETARQQVKQCQAACPAKK